MPGSSQTRVSTSREIESAAAVQYGGRFSERCSSLPTMSPVQRDGCATRAKAMTPTPARRALACSARRSRVAWRTLPSAALRPASSGSGSVRDAACRSSRRRAKTCDVRSANAATDAPQSSDTDKATSGTALAVERSASTASESRLASMNM